jgi:hypothetical protein
MITLDLWKIKPANEIDTSLKRFVYEKAFIGNELDLDDRLVWICAYLDSVSRHKAVVSYNDQSASLEFENPTRSIPIGLIGEIDVPEGRIILDATSLLFPELLYLMEWASLVKKPFDVIYVEPSTYTQKPYRSRIGMQSIDYSLSDDGPGLGMLPRFTLPLNDGAMVVALGYEGHRFGSLLASDEVTPSVVTGIVGVPPFVLGWERNTYSKNHIPMAEAHKNYDAEFKVAPANDPIQNYDVLKLLLKAENATNNKRKRGLHLVPMGTKPVALAMAWFAINNKGTAVLYDFIKKRKKRSSGVGKVHLWRFSVDSR